MLLTTQAQAQDSDTRGGYEDGDAIIVTARRVEERLQDVPISITVYSQDQLDDRNITIPSDLAVYTPSLSVSQRFGPEKANFTIRGFTEELSTSPTVGVYFADVVGVRAQGGTTSGNTVGAGSFVDLQNVQVLKGPQGTLFGRNTTGGAVLLVPKKPTDRLEGYIEGSVGNFDMRRGQAVLNVPLADTFKVRLAVDANRRDGYMRNHSGIGAKDFNDLNYVAARLSILAELTPTLENYTIAHFSVSDTNGFAGRYVTCNPAASGLTALTARAACDLIARQDARGDSLLDVEVSNANPFVRLKQWQVINTTTWQASDSLTVKNIASYGEFRERTSWNLFSDNFFVSNPAPSLAALGIPALTPGTPFAFVVSDVPDGQDTATQYSFTEELQLQGRTERLDWVLGGYLEFSRPNGWNSSLNASYLSCASVADLRCTNPFVIGSITSSRTKYSFNNHGVFAQATYKLSEQISVTGGLRYTFDSVKAVGENTRFRFLPGAAGVRDQVCADTIRFKNADGTFPRVVTDPSQCHTETSTRSSRPTWLIGLDYKPVDDLMAYAKYTRGYRQGGINLTNIGIETWGPEKVDAYEVGAKVSFHGAIRGYLNAAAFYNDFRDQQIGATLLAKPTSGLSGGGAILNAGKSRIQGLELDGGLTPLTGFDLNLGYTYLDTKLQTFTAPVLPPDSPFLTAIASAVVGEPLVLSPKHRVTVSAKYTLPLAEEIGQLSLGGTFVYTSGQLGLAANPPSIRNIASTSLLNLNVNWDSIFESGLDAAFFMTNATNKIYQVNTSGGYSATGAGNWIMGPPRMYGFRLRYNFGG